MLFSGSINGLFELQWFMSKEEMIPKVRTEPWPKMESNTGPRMGWARVIRTVSNSGIY
jgi:hypothetical protein